MKNSIQIKQIDENNSYVILYHDKINLKLFKKNIKQMSFHEFLFAQCNFESNISIDYGIDCILLQFPTNIKEVVLKKFNLQEL
jgi:hypothetical protein